MKRRRPAAISVAFIAQFGTPVAQRSSFDGASVVCQKAQRTRQFNTRVPHAQLVQNEKKRSGLNNTGPDNKASASSADLASLQSVLNEEAYGKAARVESSSARQTTKVLSNEKGNEGPPLRYNRAELKKYWDARRMELNQRYLAFAGRAAPFAGSVIRHIATGTLTQDQVIASLATQAREGMEALGPTYIKMGQMMSIRPDVIPRAAMDELQKLQDGVARFDNDVAKLVVEEELGCPLETVFSEFSEEPIAAASLAQVYRGRLRENGIEVAIKVQRPEALTLCSKDMYVLQRAVGVYQGVMQRWTAQDVDYNALLESFASGFYEELDFENEARNQDDARRAIMDGSSGLVYVPMVFMKYSSRRLLVTEFVYGTKLTDCERGELRRLTAVAQECFLKQLLEPGQRLHCDAHGGNQLAWNAEATFAAQSEGFDPNAPPTKSWDKGEDGTLIELGLRPELVLIDFGLMMSIPEDEKSMLILAVVHMANKDWDAVTEDLVALRFLPADIDRGTVTPLLARVLAPYVLDGGGASAYIKEGVFSPSFQNLMRDLSAAAVEIPFSIPAYWPVLGRGIAILEGIALTGDPNYKIVLSAYPFVTRKLLEEAEDDSFRTALNAILYPISDDGVKQPRPSPRRILALINNALGRAAAADASDGMIDMDALPEDAASLTETLAFLGSDKAGAIRQVLVEQLAVGVDLVLRSATRRIATSVQNFTSFKLPTPSLPFLPQPRVPVLNPLNLIPDTIRNTVVDQVAPPLSTEEDIYVGNILEVSETFLGIDLQAIATGVLSPQQVLQVLSPVLVAMSGQAVSGTVARETQENSERFLQELVTLLPQPSSFWQFGTNAPFDEKSVGEASDAYRLKARSSLISIAQDVFNRLRDEQKGRLDVLTGK